MLAARVDVVVLQLLGLLEELHDEEKRHEVEAQVEQQRGRRTLAQTGPDEGHFGASLLRKG